MKKSLVLILGIFLGVLIIGTIISILVFDIFGSSSRPPNSSINPQVSSAENTSTPERISSAGTQAVDFAMNITSIQNTGPTSRNITVVFFNNGTNDAHNVKVKVELLCQGKRIKVNDQDFITQTLGIIKSDGALTDSLALSYSAPDADKITQMGTNINLTVISDEKTQSFSYNYKP